MSRWALKTLIITSILTLGMAKSAFATQVYPAQILASSTQFYPTCLGHFCSWSMTALGYATDNSQQQGFYLVNGTSTPTFPLDPYPLNTSSNFSNYPLNTNTSFGSFGGKFGYPNVDLDIKALSGSMATNTPYIMWFWNAQYGGNYFLYSYNGTDINLWFPPSYYTTRIVSVIPDSNTNIVPIGATSTADFDVDLLTFYNNNSNATSTIYKIITTLTNNTFDYFSYTSAINIPNYANGIGTTTYNVAHNVPFGNYDLQITLYNNNLDILNSTTSSNITFGSSTNAITFEQIYGASTSNPFDVSQVSTSSACSITDLTGCFKNALVWSLYPNMSVISAEIQNLKGAIQNKPPFGYFKILQDNMNNLNASGTAVFNILVPYVIQVNIFTPLRTGLTAILWFVGGVWLYNRIKHIRL